MNKFIEVLNNVSNSSNEKTTSDYASALLTAYNQTGAKNINSILKIWSDTINKAPLKYSRQWNKLFEALDVAIHNMYPNEKTMEKNLSAFRKPLRNEKFDKEIYKQSIYKMGISQERSNELKEIYKNKVKVRNANRNSLPPIYVNDVLELINKLIKSDFVYDLILAVELATGSRSIEVLKVSKYEATDNPMEIKVTGLAKDKGNNNLQNVVLIRNLVGLNSKQVRGAVKQIRDNLKVENLTNKEISALTNKKLNNLFRKRMATIIDNKDYVKKLTSHKTRYISGNVSYKLYGEPLGIPYESYLQEQYGHLSGESTKSYLGVNIKGDEPHYNENYDKEINQIKNDLDECCKIKTNFYKKKENKINDVVEKLKELKAKNIKITQRELRNKLGYSSEVMTAGYKKFRAI